MFFLSLLSCNFDEHLRRSFLKFVILCICCGIRQVRILEFDNIIKEAQCLQELPFWFPFWLGMRFVIDGSCGAWVSTSFLIIAPKMKESRLGSVGLSSVDTKVSMGIKGPWIKSKRLFYSLLYFFMEVLFDSLRINSKLFHHRWIIQLLQFKRPIC